VVVARRLPAAGRELLADRFELDEGELGLDREELVRRVRGAVAIVADPTVPVDGELLDAAGQALRIVANFAVGYDNVDLGACRKRGVVVTNTPDVLTNATAELAVTLMLAAARRIGEAERVVRAGRWAGWDPSGLLGRELSGATVGIVGLGRIGTRVAELIQGFGPTLLYTTRTARSETIWTEGRLGLGRVGLDELVARSDFVTLHVPLGPETHHLVDRERLARFKAGAVLVNTSRGAIVDTAALAAALRDGRLAAAGLDVYEHEPGVDPAFLELDNVVLLPHVGSATATARDAMARLVAENVIAVLEGRPPLTPVGG